MPCLTGSNSDPFDDFEDFLDSGSEFNEDPLNLLSPDKSTSDNSK
jgi:hypothetical protein